MWCDVCSNSWWDSGKMRMEPIPRIISTKVFYIHVLELELVFQVSSLLVSLITSVFPLHNVPKDTKALAIPRPDWPAGVYSSSPGGSLTISESTAALPPEQGSSAIGVGWH